MWMRTCMPAHFDHNHNHVLVRGGRQAGAACLIVLVKRPFPPRAPSQTSTIPYHGVFHLVHLHRPLPYHTMGFAAVDRTMMVVVAGGCSIWACVVCRVTERN